MSKQGTIKTTVYLPADTAEQLRHAAKDHRRSFNSELVWALQKYLSEQGYKDGPQDLQVQTDPNS